MNSLIKEQHINRRKASEDITFNRRPDSYTNRDITFPAEADEAPLLERSLNIEPSGRTERNRTGSLLTRAREIKNQASIIDFPRRQSFTDTSAVINTFAPSRGTSTRKSGENRVFTALDAIFVSNFFLFLGVLIIILTSPSALFRIISPSKFSLPGNVYSGAFIRGNALASSGTVEEGEDFDLARFEVLRVSEYTVRPRNSVSQIADDHGLNMDTIISYNRLENAQRIIEGQVLLLPDRNGLLHDVQRGDTLMGLAADYGVNLNAILDVNALESSEIRPGQEIFIPGARMNETDLRLAIGELFIYPTIGRFTSGFGMRNDPFTGVRRFHNGVDWANRVGTPIRASMAGTVRLVESQIGNYGRFVVIEHPRGFQTLYAHLNTASVVRGQYVSQNQIIGYMGNTGRSTGPHLHFSMFKDGEPVDPLPYLH